MPASRSPRRARLVLLVSAALALAGVQLLVTAPATQAAPSAGLVISEVYGAGGNSGATYTHDFIELYNPTAGAIPVGGMSVQYRSGTGTSPAFTNLTGAVPAGGHYLVQEASNAAVGMPLPTPDATGTAAMAAGAGVVLLVSDQVGVTAQGNFANAGNPANVIDTVGYGSTATTFETTNTGTNLSATTSAQRAAAGTDTDANNPDFSEALPTPQAAGPSPLAATAPAAKTGTVGLPIASFALAATGGTPAYHWSATGLPGGISVADDGTVSGTPTADGTFNGTVTVTDSAASPAQDSKPLTFTIAPAPVGTTPIATIQGTGATSTIQGQAVNTEGVVTASYPTGGLNGFYVQTPGADTPDASDAIFVYGGSSGFATYPAIGDSVDVTGIVAENFGQTELTGGEWSAHGSSLGTVTPKTVIPGTDCALPGSSCLSLAQLDVAREVDEGEAFQPLAANKWTLTDVYDGGPYYSVGTNASSMFGEEGAAAESAKPLIAPTEVYDTQTQATQLADLTKWNNAHRIVIDDGSSLNYSQAANQSEPFPWMTADYVPRVGAAVAFPAPAILINDFSQWRLLASSQVKGAPTATQPQFAQTRAANAVPQDVGGDIKLATFNVLNFFPTDGNQYEGLSPSNHCTYFTDRQGNQITTNSCGNPSTSSGNGPRGAANPANVTRQRDKIVSAINTANADIVSLEELENSAKFGKSRDDAITQLVNALNVGHPGKWDFAPSPTGADLPPLADEDVIRVGFIFQPATVSLVGASKILVGSPAFTNAREPLAQAFKQTGTADSRAFAVIVNHFKSKGSGTDDGTGQGNANPDRIAQADALVAFAQQFLTDRGLTKMFLVGDFNAYSHEDPVQVLTGNGYTQIDSTSDPDEETYNFDGQIGSLDHVFANAAANATVTGADVWPINGYESVYYEYSRFNYNATNLYDTGPFRSSDHSPEIVGISTAKATPTVAAGDGAVAYGQATTVSVTVTAADVTPTGTVTVKDGSTPLGTAPLSGGAASVPIPATSLAVGVHTLTADYSGDDNVAAGSDTFTLTVNKATSTVTAPDVSVPAGGHGTETVTVTAVGVTPTGSVTLKNGSAVLASAPLAGGQAQFNLPTLPDGTVLTAEYAGDGNVTAGSTTFTVHQGAKATPVLTVPDVSVEYGRTAPVTVRVAAPGVTPTGTITVRSGGTTVGTSSVVGGVATITLPAGSLPVGTAVLSATYSGDGNVNAATRTFSVTVVKGGSTTGVTVKPKRPKAGHKVKLNIQVAGANGVPATGTVTVKVGGKRVTVSLKGGRAVAKVKGLGRGTYKAKVSYGGDSNLTGSHTSVSFRVG